jgi:tetratricopeptide (TPR) repeat protein
LKDRQHRDRLGMLFNISNNNTILYYLTAAVTVYALFRLPAFNIPKTHALMASALFGLHPVVSSSVYPAWGRDSLLFGFFVITAVYAFLRSGWKWHILAVFLCALGLFSKEASVVIIGLFFISDILNLSADSPGKDFKKWIKRYWIIVVLYIIYFSIRQQLFGGREFEITLLNNPLLPLMTPLYALQVIITPFIELVYEPRTWSTWLSFPMIVVTGIVTILIILLSIKRWSFIKKTTLFWIAWFVLCNLPTSNILNQETIVTERFLFPSILAVIGIITGITSYYYKEIRWRKLVIGLSSGVIIVCSGITLYRSHYYQNNLVFYRQWLKFNPDYYLPNHAMGIVLFEMGKVDEAAQYYKKSIKMNPDWPDSYLNLSIIYVDQEKYDNAFKCLSKYLELRPESAKAHYSLGVVLTKQKKYNDALVNYLDAIKLDPFYTEAYHNAGVIYHIHNNLDEAIVYYKKALRIDPSKENSRQYLRTAIEEKKEKDRSNN